MTIHCVLQYVEIQIFATTSAYITKFGKISVLIVFYSSPHIPRESPAIYHHFGSHFSPDVWLSWCSTIICKAYKKYQNSINSKGKIRIDACLQVQFVQNSVNVKINYLSSIHNSAILYNHDSWQLEKNSSIIHSYCQTRADNLSG